MKAENDLELCGYMRAVRSNFEPINELWRDGRLSAMAGRLANIQAAAREAEYRINDLMRGEKSAAARSV